MERKALLFALLLVMPAFAGCNVQDWYNQQGYVALHLSIDTARNSSFDAFQSVKVAIYGVSLRQRDIAELQHFSFENDPLIVDLVEKGRAKEGVPLAEFKTSLRATDRVAVRIVVFEAIDAAGNSMPVCREDEDVEKFPCFFQPANSALLYEDKQFSPPRGGSIDVGFPVAIKFERRGRASEYFLFADPALVTLDVDR